MTSFAEFLADLIWLLVSAVLLAAPLIMSFLCDDFKCVCFSIVGSILWWTLYCNACVCACEKRIDSRILSTRAQRSRHHQQESDVEAQQLECLRRHIVQRGVFSPDLPDFTLARRRCVIREEKRAFWKRARTQVLPLQELAALKAAQYISGAQLNLWACKNGPAKYPQQLVWKIISYKKYYVDSMEELIDPR